MQTNSETEARQIRGYAIISKGEQICKAGKDCYLIPSQSGNGKYKVCVGMHMPRLREKALKLQAHFRREILAKDKTEAEARTDL